MKTRDKILVILLSTYLLISLLMTTFIPSLNDPLKYDYFDLENGQMPPINTECHYGFTDAFVMVNSLEKITSSSFYFKPILTNENCFLRLHSTSTAQGAYITEENVTINFGFNLVKGRNTFIIFYTLIFLALTNTFRLNTNNYSSISYLPYIASIPIFIYESFHFTNIIIYYCCLYLIQIRKGQLRIEDTSIIIVLSIILPLALYQSHVSIWLMFLLTWIDYETIKAKYISITAFFLLFSSIALNKINSIELTNNHYFNNMYNFIFKNKYDISSLPTYLDVNELAIINNQNNKLVYLCYLLYP